ncbi:variant SH3 domain-containing protein [Hirsutella rhossiliensis]|uniref:Variant SH3 domain-containing protein n=1 Tax=Hirsutella rhossiliensis TaxID=111463 RepID=A0A9P8SJR3_9HYPO|nr:variant SH3 domain-containing protein [Hirsutella rhossiliensis]KAH0965568.1 variant SH3 domain-containing protein [Hirsutella rhossiliensis]
MPHKHRRHHLGDIIDWFIRMNLFTTDASDLDSPDSNNTDNNNSRVRDDDDDLQQEGDAQRSRAVDDSNMAQRPGSHRAPEADVGSDDVATVVQTVFKTLAPTFQGPIAGYSTLFDDDDVPPPTASQRALSPVQTPSPSPSPAPSPAPTPASVDSKGPESSDQSSSARVSASSTRSFSNTFQAVLGNPATDPTSVPIMTDRIGLLPSASRPSASASTADLSMNRKESAAADSGSSAGVKTGIAFGVLGGVLAVVLLAYFLFNRRRKQAAARIRLDDGDEKFQPGFSAGSSPFEAPSMRGDPKAPRISLRPVGQFTPVGTAWDRPATSRSTNTANPFGIQAERVPSTIVEEQSMRSNSTSPATLFEAPRAPGSSFSQDALKINGRTMAAGAALGVATGLSRKTSMRKDGSSNVDLTLPRRNIWASPPSPAETEFSVSSVPAGSAPLATNGAVAIEAAGGPANSGVHRVELEFKPTLEDEMELRVGELVRLLHEYDDGWCLVIRLNRSQQGVVPRTCLSSRPVKPRLPPGAFRPGPPVNPSGQARGPGSLNGSRPVASESSRLRLVQSSGSTSPTSTNRRAQSPRPRQQGALSSRPQSPGGARLVTPPQPGPPPPGPPPSGPPPPGSVGRKPVPGQNLGSRSNWLKEPRPWATE